MTEELRDSFVGALKEIRERRDDLIVLVSDSTSTCRIKPFMEKYPQSVVNVGIAEQNLIGIAAGLSMGGFIPFSANAAPFLMGRSNEQVKTDICYSESNVKLVGLNPGFAYGSLGPTHHCLDDISTALAWGHIQIFAPSDPEEVRQVTRYAVDYSGPVYIRLDSFKGDNIHPEDYKFIPGEPVILRKGDDLTLVALGTMAHGALDAADELAQKGIGAEVISLPSIRPLRPEKIIESLKKTGRALTLEEHSIHGGVGSITGDIILENRLGCALKKLGVPAGQFAAASPRDDIKSDFKLDRAGILSEALSLMGEES